MLNTYRAILRGNQLEWVDKPPTSRKPTPVHITILPDETSDDRNVERMVNALKALAHTGGIAAIHDPLAWQNQVRADNPLPGRHDNAARQ